ncbi:alpha/beta fold hydrolase [Flavihumibacter petaseus]|uniref:Putative hydrolase n=1 Tax=Flavihumibacter petaseus NBRC 106054 TaxID=1220578 RepID=A0A0E9N525_9BACT|nr:alpha/beta hydrolase [Flavihumibacter petaseus]GAO44893.1 putative hydrolase [Flavihumibacter petaseus NBRC 106054]
MHRKYTPSVQTAALVYRDHRFNIEYFYRHGSKDIIVFAHGLGGCKENFWEAVKSEALCNNTLIAMDNPGTGNSTYYDHLCWNIDDLVNVMELFITHLALDSFWLCGSSMGGLTTLRYLKGANAHKVKGYINIEGNLLAEDCMFSAKVVRHDWPTFQQQIFDNTVREMKSKGNTGYHIIANNLQLNTDVHAYYQYSFQTVAYSSTGELLQQYLALELPALFIYGSANKHLSYLSLLREQGKQVAAISNSDHFVFYDNPFELYQVIGNFVQQHSCSTVIPGYCN